MEDAAKLKVLTRILIMSCYTDMILCKVAISSILHNCWQLSENTNQLSDKFVFLVLSNIADSKTYQSQPKK